MDKGEVWIYFDKDAEKRRPCVVVGYRLGVKDTDIATVKITTSVPRNKFDVPLENWKEFGLYKASTVRCSKLFTLKEEELLFKVAQIEGDELLKIKQTIAEYIMA